MLNIPQTVLTNVHPQFESIKNLPASLAPIPIGRQEIQGLVAWITREGKVSYLDASMAVETPVINAAIKLGLIVEQDAYLFLAGLLEQVVFHTHNHLLQSTADFWEPYLPVTGEDLERVIFGA